MIRVEIFLNQSVEDVLFNNLEAAIPDFFYSVQPLTYGRGKDSRKLGTTTWPETNMTLIAYLEDDKEEVVRTVVDYVKGKFPTEGIKMFVLHDRV